jgi:thiol-disulfide isomerase/thioredoxin
MTFYYREGCHLCEAFDEELQILQQQRHFEFERVDVDTSADLAEKYGLRVPVLTCGGEVICESFLDPERLHAYVQ